VWGNCWLSYKAYVEHLAVSETMCSPLAWGYISYILSFSPHSWIRLQQTWQSRANQGLQGLHCWTLLHQVWKPSLSGWWYTYPSEKYESVGMIIPNIWKNISQWEGLSHIYKYVYGKWKNMSSSVGIMKFPTERKNEINGPNHQSAIDHF
jgi:hypothetical protein